MGLSSESEQSVTADNDDLNVGAESNTKISYVSSVRSSINSPTASESLDRLFYQAYEMNGRTINVFFLVQISI